MLSGSSLVVVVVVVEVGACWADGSVLALCGFAVLLVVVVLC